MTARATLHALIERDMKREPRNEDALLCSEFEEICNALIGRAFDCDKLLDCAARNAETDGAFLSDDEAACVLHIANGGNLDVSLGTVR